MNYQSKTTVVSILIWDWDAEKYCSSPTSKIEAAHAAAVQIATHCGMDVMSIIPYASPDKDDHHCYATVVYVNNGRSLDDIRLIMQPETNTNPPTRYWMIQDIYEWEGHLHCIVAVQGKNKWD